MSHLVGSLAASTPIPKEPFSFGMLVGMAIILTSVGLVTNVQLVMRPQMWGRPFLKS